MAITKILARRARLDLGIRYALNPDKTEETALTAFHNCTPSDPYGAMKDTKARFGKTDGVQYYHLVQAFKPGEITPELALEIVQKFTEQHLSDFETVIGVHTDKDHIHAHIVFNSVSCVDGRKYHSSPQSYYRQIRKVSDNLCREHGLSVILRAEDSKARPYAEWLRERSGQTTWRGMLVQDMQAAIAQAADYGHFLVLMEEMGYEVKHGRHLSFRLRGTKYFIRPDRDEPTLSQENIRAAVEEGLSAPSRPVSRALPSEGKRPRRQRTPKLTGFLGLYAHYLALLRRGTSGRTPGTKSPAANAQLKRAGARLAQFEEQNEFLLSHNLTSTEELKSYQAEGENRLASLMKSRTILNVQKKKRQALFCALADLHSLRPAKELYESGVAGAEEAYEAYLKAEKTIGESGVPAEALREQKAALYGRLAQVNREIREERKKLSLCGQILETVPKITRELERENRQNENNKQKEAEVKNHGRRRT